MTTIQTAIEEGLDFILSHFQNPIWPRTISTKATEGGTGSCKRINGSIVRFSQANYMDCRISAYPPNALENPSATQRFLGIQTRHHHIYRNDRLDRCKFKTERGFKIAYTRL